MLIRYCRTWRREHAPRPLSAAACALAAELPEDTAAIARRKPAGSRGEKSAVAVPPVGLVAGMPRSGTTWLIKMLNAHPDAAAFGETQFWGRTYTAPDPKGLYGPGQLKRVAAHLKYNLQTSLSAIGEGPGCLRSMGPEDIDSFVDTFVGGLVPPLTPAEFFTGLCAAVAEAEGKRFCVEKTPHHVNWLDRIWEALPGVRVVLTIREPYGFALSYKHADRIPTIARKREYRRLYHPLGCALVWRTSLRAALRARSLRPGQVLVVDLADVRADEAGTIARVQEFLGIPPAETAGSLPPDNTSFPGEEKPELQPDDLFWINLVCRREMGQLGINRRPAGFAPWRLLISTLKLPIWAFWKLRDLHRRSAGSTLKYIWRWLRPGCPR